MAVAAAVVVAAAIAADTAPAAVVGVVDDEDDDDGVVLTIGKIDLGKKGMVFVAVARGGCCYGEGGKRS